MTDPTSIVKTLGEAAWKLKELNGQVSFDVQFLVPVFDPIVLEAFTKPRRSGFTHERLDRRHKTLE